MTEPHASAHALAEATARNSYSKLVAYLAVQTRNIAAAEDALADAFAKALTDWPVNGCPDKPEAWLLTVARRRAIDGARRQQRGDEINRELQLISGLGGNEPSEIPDRRLALMFACAHPAIDRKMHAPLILQVILGLKAETIASAFLIAPSTMGQRLVRAKNKLKQAGIPFEVPRKNELAGRLGSVLDSIYVTYTEGWGDPEGVDLKRRGLADEAIFLCSLVTGLLPEEPEALGLLALMLYADSRRSTRRDSSGRYIPLAQQPPDDWDHDLIKRAETALHQAGSFGKAGRFQVEAALQSAHIHRHVSGESNWHAVLNLYNALFELTGSPVVAINRALAIAEVNGVRAALDELDSVSENHPVAEYQPYWAMRAELLTRAGEPEKAAQAYDIAIGLEKDQSVRAFLQDRKTKSQQNSQ